MKKQFNTLIENDHQAALLSGWKLTVFSLTLTAALLSSVTVQAVEIPPAGSVFEMQTNGADAAIGLGDWYTSTSGGNGYHYLKLYVPDGWSPAAPIHLDLYSPEMNCNNPLDETDAGGNSSATFELYGPGTVFGSYATPGPATAGSLGSTTYPPVTTNCGSTPQWQRLTIPAPVAPGAYLVRAGISAGDQNGWRLRFGIDNDGDPNTIPPANTDNPDGIAGSGDELGAAILQGTFQQDDVGTECLNQYQFVSGNPASLTFNNFDLDNNATVEYFGPDATNFTGTASSGQANWNPFQSTRIGDTITTAMYGGSLNGVWRVETCITPNNQFIQEMQDGVPWFFAPPSHPVIGLSKDDGLTEVSAGQSVTYSIDFSNSGSGASISNVLTDTLPANSNFVSCSINAPYNGAGSSCSHSAGVVTYVLVPDLIPAGGSGSVTLDIQVDPAYPGGDFINTADITYNQLWYLNSYSATANDTDTFAVLDTDLQIVKTASPDPVESGQTLTYTLVVTNNGPGIAPDVVINDTLPAEVTWVSSTPSAGGSCSIPNGVTCEFNYILPNASASVIIVVTVN